MFLILCGANAAGGSNINCKFSDLVATEMAKAQTHESGSSNIDGKFDLLWGNDRPISDLVATEMAKAQTHESTLTNCGASAMCNEGLSTLEENSMLFMRNSLHFMKHI
ncbi:unnamed protein product [Brugia pahangi]|uniref:SCP domain-containing protein n=1 Tax=Brugia pahangi TaxID=6280 RepID=A0A0N4T367_BRUPA|nr:unnamed protein product [Brugia pahangi]